MSEGEQRHFMVEWSIEISASSAREAAEAARAIQRDPAGYYANSFTVIEMDSGGEAITINLDEETGDDEKNSQV